MPKLTYQTAVASLTQFIIVMFLGIPVTIISILTTCHNDQSNCVSNMIVTLILYILTAGWFGFIMLIGYTAQRKRSRQFAAILIGLELITLVVSGPLDVPHDTNFLSKVASLVDALLSLWVIYLAARLFLAGGKRIVKRPNVVSRARKAR